MKILFDASVLQQPLTGVGKATLALYQACLALRPNLQFTALYQRPLSCALPAAIAAVRRGAALPSAVWRQALLPVMLRGRDAHAMHFPWNGNVPALLPKTPVVMTLHDILPLIIPGHFQSERARSGYRQRLQKDFSRSAVVFTVSEFSRNEIQKNFELKKPPVIIRNAPTLISPSEPGDVAESGSYFLYVGGYDRRKGLEPLLKVFLDLQRAGKLRSQLILTGSQHYFSDSFRHLVEEGRRTGGITEKGYVSDEALARLFLHARALVYPSKFEGFGLPPLEAMALGCPVLTTRHTALPEICGDAALYADAEDERSMAGALQRLENDTDLRETLCLAGRRQAAQFSWQASAEIFLAELDQLAAGA